MKRGRKPFDRNLMDVRCPACAGVDSSVADTRPTLGGLRRRRTCHCGQRFSTLESTKSQLENLRYLSTEQLNQAIEKLRDILSALEQLPS